MRDGWDDDPEPTNTGKLSMPSPQYGGTPVYINQKLIEAQANGDGDAEIELHRIRSKLFRNRRSGRDNTVKQARLRAAWIEKYGDAGRAALSYDDMLRKLALLTKQEQQTLLDAQIEAQQADEWSAPATGGEEE